MNIYSSIDDRSGAEVSSFADLFRDSSLQSGKIGGPHFSSRAVETELRFTPNLDQPRIREFLEVVGHGGLRDGESGNKVGAGNLFGGGNAPENFKASGIRQHSADALKLFLVHARHFKSGPAAGWTA